jgi:hypothetical protein
MNEINDVLWCSGGHVTSGASRDIVGAARVARAALELWMCLSRS